MTASTMSLPALTHRRVTTALAWTLQGIGLAMFAMSGAAKLVGTPAMVALFEAIGIGHWFRYTTGGLEVIGALLLMVPSRAGIGAALLASLMAGAVLTHLVVLHTSPLIPIGLLAAMLTVAWLRREPLVWLAREYGLLTDRTSTTPNPMSPEAAP